ncbi:hypothetical protein ABZT06_20610 [Streptomyces sp. NPDC005483]|uniref:hypothetical protein n=1 Tax=Streptomyces sp. NPDC005483 TaxID=3154882 RepID=UPI0033B25644
MSVTYERPGRAALHLARAASLAPSPHHSQPWFFLFARAAVIACGATLFNVRLAVRQLGFRPVLDLLPAPGDAHHQAHAPSTAEEPLPARAIARRHTHRGRFGAEPVADAPLAELYEQARAEGATLQVVDDADQPELVADLVRTAKDAHRADIRHVTEPARCAGPHRVPVDACRQHSDATLLPGRSYLSLTRRHLVSARDRGGGTGTVVVLSTPHCRRPDWLRAWQALQRVLLYAAAHDVMAAFPTQPLELPAPRALRRTECTAGRYPQLALRLGHVSPPQQQAWCTHRRPPAQVLVREDVTARW